jgi:hypothetical protein
MGRAELMSSACAQCSASRVVAIVLALKRCRDPPKRLVGIGRPQGGQNRPAGRAPPLERLRERGALSADERIHLRVKLSVEKVEVGRLTSDRARSHLIGLSQVEHDVGDAPAGCQASSDG